MPDPSAQAQIAELQSKVARMDAELITLTRALHIDAATGDIILNEEGLNRNVRVESIDNENMLFVDRNRVGVKTGTPTTDFQVNGAIASGATNTAIGSDAIDVDTVNAIFMTTTGGDITIGGLRNGVFGQKVTITKITAANNMIVENNEPGATQKIFLSGNADKTFANYGGVNLICNGTHWFETSDT